MEVIWSQAMGKAPEKQRVQGFGEVIRHIQETGAGTNMCTGKQGKTVRE
jgi:hypothetical protein